MRPKQSSPPSHGPPSYGIDATGPSAGTERQNLAMLLAYDGNLFQGWQVQPHGPSVQAKLEEALAVIFREPVKVHGSGRTDTGVHALGQVANFFAPDNRGLRKLQTSLNALCAPAISVKEIAPVSSDFNARHSAAGKTYRYHIFNRAYPPVFGRQRCWWVRTPLDVPAMAEAARALTGQHDFSAFRAVGCTAKSAVREMRRLEVSENENRDSTIRIEIEASGFLQHMARIIAGTLIAVGRGRIAARDMGGILAGRDREAADITAPGKGLYLVRVAYDLERYPELRIFEDSG